MKKICAIIALICCTIFFVGCGNSIEVQTSGIIDCYTISTVGFDGSYTESEKTIYKYTNKEGKSIYTIYAYGNGDYILPIYLYDKHDEQEGDLYSYVGSCGTIIEEHNYYYDIDNNMIISEIKYKESKKYNNVKAYSEMIKSAQYNFYPNYSSYNTEYYIIYEDRIEKGFSQYTYIKLGEDATVKYKKKWF